METKGIVLWESKYKESSKILRVYTREYGKISVMVHGALKKNSKFRMHTIPYFENLYKLGQGKSFYFIKDADTLESFYEINKNFHKMLYASIIMEWIDKSNDNDYPSIEIYDLTIHTFRYILKEENPKNIFFSYGFKCLKYSGFYPVINECVNCGNRKIKEMKFGIIEGGILCEHCFKSSEYYIKISKKEYVCLYNLINLPWDDLVKKNYTDEDFKTIKKILGYALYYYTGVKSLKSLEIYDKYVTKN